MHSDVPLVSGWIGGWTIPPWPSLDPLLHDSSRLERNTVRFRDVDLFACSRIACPPSSTSLHLEDAEPTQFNPPVGCQRFQDATQDALDDQLGLLFTDVEMDADGLGDLLLCHACILAALNTVDCGQGRLSPQTKPRFTAQTAAAVRSGMSNLRRMF